MALLARQLYFEAVKTGDELPPLVKPPLDRIQLARYAGASGDYNPLYVDEQHAKNAGFPSALAPGMLAMGFIGELVVDWLRGARLRRFAARFVKIIWPGDVLTSRGRVVDRRFEGGGVYAVDIEVWTENQRGELVLKGLVTAQLYYNADDDAHQRAGQGPLVVTQQEEEARLAKLSRAQPPKKPEPARAPPPPPRPAPARPGTLPQRPGTLPQRPGTLPQRPGTLPQRPGTLPQRPAAAIPAPSRAGPRPTRPPPAPVASPTSGMTRRPPAHPAAEAAPSRPATAVSPETRPGARSRTAAKAHRPAGGKRHVPRSAARPAAKAKPAARASRPRPGSKPTGKKRR